jgi:hypothetical protein
VVDQLDVKAVVGAILINAVHKDFAKEAIRKSRLLEDIWNGKSSKKIKIVAGYLLLKRTFFEY